ncbi:sigma-54-dependent Fis family transcriptional regulator [bacterium]|jgi:DNA-binding NtrC family response regulator|nr:sigma-54-dependent Fis family transcriptional regulator [bacterium]MBT4927981.1 sigma-54-dependent Fis family transcriptional regulator [bacterium]MBT6018368.1 sigma-54-dependent Fis family transcriptional regulator [bacterium]
MIDPILYVGDSFDVKQILNESGKRIDAVQNGMIALNALADSENRYSAVIIEDQLPLMDPSNLIKQLEHYSKTPIIAIVRSDKRRSEILTDFDNGLSGWFEPKGSSVEHFNELIDSCSTFINFSRGLNKNQRRQINSHGLSTILGVSDSMQKIYTLLLQIQEKDVITILYGESGTGKNLTAKFMHDTSKRSKKPLVSVNCPAIPSELLESELFGHEKGSFTGADEKKDGKFLVANGGTIFLDEIGDMSTSLQAKILRVLESGEIERVGGAETHTVDVRVISATNQDLNEKIKEGEFREDLFHRINVFPVTLPPLRDRKVDIPLLTYAIFKSLKKKHSLNVAYIAPKAIDRLIDYSWPGNVRELENTLERALLICNNKYLTEEDLGAVLDEKETIIDAQKERDTIKPGLEEEPEKNPPLNSDAVVETITDSNPILKIATLKEIEMDAIKSSVERNKWNMTTTAEELGISRMTLYRKLEQYGLRGKE